MVENRDSIKLHVLICVGIMAVTAWIEYSMGRLPFCKCGVIRLWSGNIWSSQNSQQLIDPYTFTHILHGVVWYGLIWLIFPKRLTVAQRLTIAVAVESGWEVLENSNFIIDRYRTATISLDYYGDSIFNSMGDILAMAFGFLLAWRLPVRWIAVGAVTLDLLLLLWIHDNLALNVIMLIRPIAVIRNWQLLR